MVKMTQEMLKKHKKQTALEINKEMKRAKTAAERKKILIDGANKFIRGEKCSVCGKKIKK